MICIASKSIVVILVALLMKTGALPPTPAGVVPCDKEGWIHTCDDGSCIHDDHLCDGVKDCADGSDELPYANVTDRIGYECAVRSNPEQKCFLNQSYVCDQTSQCLEDECNCTRSPFRCSPTECVSQVNFCDQKVHCTNEIDELPYRDKDDGIKCWTVYSGQQACGLPAELRCDGKQKCVQGGDQCFCGTQDGGYDDASFFDDKCFRCLDGRGEMLETHLCNGFIACSDLSDECLCPDPIPICAQLTYEENCEFRCRPSEKVNGTKCIKKTQICDLKRDCPYGEDEKFCQNVHTIKVEVLSDFYKKHMKEFWCCNAGFPADCMYNETFTNETHDGCDQFYPCPADPRYSPEAKYGILCDGEPSCSGSYDECANCSHGMDFCVEHKHGFSCPIHNYPEPFPHRRMCDGVADCNSTNPEESWDEMNCSGRFYCAKPFKDFGGGLIVSIAEDSVCDCIIDCEDGSDEKNCPNKTMFCCWNKIEAVEKSGVCNGIDDCTDGSDECQSCIESPFADDEHLISNKALRAFVWIIGICSSLGNFYVFTFSMLNVRLKDQRIVARITSLHVAALSLADFCVGVYLMCLGIVDAVYSGRYCHADKSWRSGSVCSFLGVLSMFGTQASVFMLTLMTLDRLHSVFRPFSKPSVQRRFVQILVLLLVALAFAFIPVIGSFEDYFTSHVRMKKNKFLQKDVNRTEFSDFVNRLSTYGPEFREILGYKRPLYPWQTLFNSMRYLNDTFEPDFQFGYYSSHGVCLPKLFPVLADSSWQYSISLIAINFSAFFVILLSYIALYRRALKTHNTAVEPSHGRPSQAAVIQKRITRIIATDFFCWMPICVIAWLKISGIYVSDEVYAIAAIVILPINSAINPFLYSDLPDMIWYRTRWLMYVVKHGGTEGIEEELPPMTPKSLSKKSTMRTQISMMSRQRTQKLPSPH